MRAFVTGGHGFVGRWLCDHLKAEGDETIAPSLEELDINDGDGVRSALVAAAPDVIYHIAGLAHVGDSWKEPLRFLTVNTMGTLKVLEGARACASPPRVLVVSSAEVYGSVRPADLPIRETASLAPVSPYAASKASAEILAQQEYRGHGLPVVIARPFNHIGPGQAPTFVVPAFAHRIVTTQREGTGALRVGNLTARRDLTDVRDVVRAYRLLVEHGEPGEAYNVCTGRDVAIEELVTRLLELSGANLTVEVDPDLMRPADVPALRGDPAKLAAATGWAPEIALDDSLRAVLDEARG